jgi:NADH-quinone oxidoreductase subunit C
MKGKGVVNMISKKFKVKWKVDGKRRAWVTINSRELLGLCKYAKKLGFEHLSLISVTDLLQEGKYELTYHLWSYSNKTGLSIKTDTGRENPVIASVVPVWMENAQIHERELHELFGVKFKGNRNLSPLFLEGWEGPPPFRRDFDWRSYVRKKHYDKDRERERNYWEGAK